MRRSECIVQAKNNQIRDQESYNQREHEVIFLTVREGSYDEPDIEERRKDEASDRLECDTDYLNGQKSLIDCQDKPSITMQRAISPFEDFLLSEDELFERRGRRVKKKLQSLRKELGWSHECGAPQIVVDDLDIGVVEQRVQESLCCSQESSLFSERSPLSWLHLKGHHLEYSYVLHYNSFAFNQLLPQHLKDNEKRGAKLEIKSPGEEQGQLTDQSTQKPEKRMPNSKKSCDQIHSRLSHILTIGERSVMGNVKEINNDIHARTVNLLFVVEHHDLRATWYSQTLLPPPAQRLRPKIILSSTPRTQSTSPNRKLLDFYQCYYQQRTLDSRGLDATTRIEWILCYEKLQYYLTQEILKYLNSFQQKNNHLFLI